MPLSGTGLGLASRGHGWRYVVSSDLIWVMKGLIMTPIAIVDEIHHDACYHLICILRLSNRGASKP